MKEFIEHKKKELADKYGLDCPYSANDNNSGTITEEEYDRVFEEWIPVPVQCEFCYTEPKSKFNLKNDIESALIEAYNQGVDDCIKVCDTAIETDFTGALRNRVWIRFSIQQLKKEQHNG